MSATEAVPTKTMAWDYKVEVLTHGFLGYHKDEIDQGDLEKALDRIGRDGFELAWVLMDQKIHGHKNGHVLIFKRPVEV